MNEPDPFAIVFRILALVCLGVIIGLQVSILHAVTHG
jgi:hypothetical protein